MLNHPALARPNPKQEYVAGGHKADRKQSRGGPFEAPRAYSPAKAREYPHPIHTGNSRCNRRLPFVARFQRRVRSEAPEVMFGFSDQYPAREECLSWRAGR